MSTIGFKCQTRTHSPSSRRWEIFILTAILASGGGWLSVETKAQTAVKSTEADGGKYSYDGQPGGASRCRLPRDEPHTHHASGLHCRLICSQDRRRGGIQDAAGSDEGSIVQ